MPLYKSQIVKSLALSSPYTNSLQTNVDTNLSFQASPNTVYNIRISGTQSKDAGTAGAKMQITAPTGSTASGIWFRGLTVQGTSLQNEVITAINTLSSGVFGNAATTVFAFRCEVTVSTGSTGGAIALGVASVTSGTVTVNAGASMEIIKSSAV